MSARSTFRVRSRVAWPTTGGIEPVLLDACRGSPRARGRGPRSRPGARPRAAARGARPERASRRTRRRPWSTRRRRGWASPGELHDADRVGGRDDAENQRGVGDQAVVDPDTAARAATLRPRRPAGAAPPPPDPPFRTHSRRALTRVRPVLTEGIVSGKGREAGPRPAPPRLGAPRRLDKGHMA